MKFVVRASCEYLSTLEAENEEDAKRQAEALDPLTGWDSAAWSEIEVEEDE
jgi:hypothetical protein